MDGFKIINPATEWKRPPALNVRDPNRPLRDQPYGGARVSQCTDTEERACYGEGPMPLTFGRWTFDPARQSLDHAEGYEIDLRTMGTPAGMLDWIFQLSAKTWATEEDLGHLVRALHEIFDPQRTLCSMGQAAHFNAERYLTDRFPASANENSPTP